MVRNDELTKLIENKNNIVKMPVLFAGHGSPMNAIEENEFVNGFRNVVKLIPLPKAIICISAHWETKGTFVTSMNHPRTIHDFSGFPRQLYEINYPAPGSPELAKEIKTTIKNIPIGLDEKWGLDHGTWSVIKHLYPDANIPIIQMSLDMSKPAKYHYDLAKELKKFRQKGVLIVGSGNLVHNLSMISWTMLNQIYAYDWAKEAIEKMKDYIIKSDHQSLINYASQGKSFHLAIPSPEHYLPLLYLLALQDEQDKVTLFNEKPVAGSLNMTSIILTSQE